MNDVTYINYTIQLSYQKKIVHGEFHYVRVVYGGAYPAPGFSRRSDQGLNPFESATPCARNF